MVYLLCAERKYCEKVSAVYYLILPLAYLVGGVNFGIIISKFFFKKDIRQSGSGNAGATNMLRTYGKAAAAVVFIGDVIKGAIIVLLARWATGGRQDIQYVVFLSGLLAILGHVFPVYFKFKGGKGVATTFGVILALEPIAALALFVVFIVIAVATKYISLGSVISAVLLPVGLIISAYIRGERIVEEAVFGVIVAVLVIFMHRQNIKRLINGTESKIKAGKA